MVRRYACTARLDESHYDNPEFKTGALVRIEAARGMWNQPRRRESSGALGGLGAPFMKNTPQPGGRRDLTESGQTAGGMPTGAEFGGGPASSVGVNSPPLPAALFQCLVMIRNR